MIVDITNEILTKLKNDLIGVEVITANQEVDVFPRLVFREMLNTTHLDSVDSAGENKNELTFEINIYTTGDRRMSDAKTIRNNADAVMADFYNMSRVFSDEVPNYFDKRIYRYVLRYTAIVDKNEVIYRR